MEEEEQKVSDREFLDQIRERLKSCGQSVVIVDTSLIKFAKFASLLFGIFVLIGLTLFGVNIEKTAEQLRQAKDKLEKANVALEEQNLKSEKLLEEAREKLIDLEKREAAAKTNADRNLEQTMTAFADFVRAAPDANIKNKEERGKWASVIRDYFEKNIAFASEIGMTSVQISMLRRLAKLEREMENVEAYERYFEEAIRLAKADGQFRLAGELQLEYATAIITRSSSSSISGSVKARRILESAIANFDQAGNNAAKVSALLQLAGVHELERSYERALEELEKAREIYRGFEISEELLFIINRQARMSEQLGDIESAKRAIRESISVAEDLDEFDFASNKYVKLARLADSENEAISSLCLAWRTLQQVDAEESKIERFLARAERISGNFKTSEC